jgi:hypothetical protein
LRTFKFLVFFLVISFAALAEPAYSASLSLTVTTDRQAVNGAIYNVGSAVTFTGSVSNGSAVPDALVLFEVDNPKQSPWLIRTLTTGQTPPGPWTSVQLLSVTPCDSGGTPQSSFSPGQDAGFEVTLKNNAGNANPVLVTITLVFSDGRPFLLKTIVNTTLQAGQQWGTIMWPVPLPANSVTGQAMVYASAFNDYPKNGGLPYSPELSAAFDIGSSTPSQPPQNSLFGTFNLTAPVTYIPQIPIWLGNYTAYARTKYGYSIASNQTTFTVKLVGDMNGDGKIDITDIATVAKAFGTQPGNPRWNPAADISGPIPLVPDGRVDISDIAVVAKEFGTVAIP